MKALAIMAAPKIRVNTVSPGLLLTVRFSVIVALLFRGASRFPTLQRMNSNSSELIGVGQRVFGRDQGEASAEY